MSGHTHEGQHNIDPSEAREATPGGGRLPKRAGGLPGSAPRSYGVGVGSSRLQGLGRERSPSSDTPHQHDPWQTCSFRFFKQNPPLKMYLQTFILPQAYTWYCKNLLHLPKPGGVSLEQAPVAPSPPPPLRPTELHQAPGRAASHTKARHSHVFPKPQCRLLLWQVSSIEMGLICSWGHEPSPGPDSASPPSMSLEGTAPRPG